MQDRAGRLETEAHWCVSHSWMSCRDETQDGWKDGWMVGWTVGRTVGRMDGWQAEDGWTEERREEMESGEMSKLLH